MTKEIKVSTHNGTFHLDDLLSVAIVKLLFPGQIVKVFRTRDPETLKNSDWVLDVGGEYDHTHRRYDHHQFDSPIRDNGIPYATFGLLWRHYGEVLCKTIKAAELIEQEIVQMLDGPDNGYETTKSLVEGGRVPSLHLLSVIFNPNWNEETIDSDKNFFEALEIVSELLKHLINHYDARVLSELEFAKAYNISTDKEIIISPKGTYPSNIELFPEVKFIVSYDSENDNWKAKCVSGPGFKCRVGFPIAWQGLRDLELQKVSNINDAEFVHNAGFLAVAKSQPAIIEMCHQAIIENRSE